MNGADIIAIIILAAIVIAVLAYLLHWLYRHSTKDHSFVRTGFRGEKVVMGGGSLVLPIVHDLTEVNMNTLRLEVVRAREKSLITKDRMRVELAVEFYIRVIPTKEAVSTAARTLGNRTMDPESLRDLIQGRFVDAMGAVAASMEMEEIHENRSKFVKAITAEVADSLTSSGLELETVSLTSLEQTDIGLFNPANAFDAEGLTRLTEEIEKRKKKRNDIEQDSMIAIRKKNLEAEKLALNIQRESEYARLDEDREVAVRRAEQKAEVEQMNAAKEREIETTRIKERKEIESTRIQMEQALEAHEIKQKAEVQQMNATKEREIETNRIKERKEVESARIEMEQALEAHEIQQKAEVEQMNTTKMREIETTRINERREVESARILMEQELETLEIQQKADVKQMSTIKEREIEATRINEHKHVEAMRISTEQELEVQEINRQETREIEEQQREIAVSQKSKERSEAETLAEGARAKMIEAKEKSLTIRDTEIANRRKSIELIAAAQEADREAIVLKTLAEANKAAAKDEADAERISLAAAAERYAVDAKGKQALNEAENLRSDANRRGTLHQRLIEHLPDIIRESVKPMENIDEIKILHVQGLPGLSDNAGSGGSGGKKGSKSGSPSDGNLSDQVVNSALRYRSQAPFVDTLLGEIGMNAENIHRMEGLQDLSKIVYTQPEEAKPEEKPPAAKTPAAKPKPKK